MGSINWQEFEEGEFPSARAKFVNAGDKITGTITNLRITDFGGTGERTPELWIETEDGTEVSVAASQVGLRRALASARPAVGDKIAIVYTGDGKSSKAGFSPPKLFDVAVKRADGTETPAAAPTEEPAPAAAGAPTADSLI